MFILPPLSGPLKHASLRRPPVAKSVGVPPIWGAGGSGFESRMKFLIIVVALIGLVCCHSKCTSSSSPNLEDDFDDITKLIPTAAVKEISKKYSNDEDVKDIIKFFQGDTFSSTHALDDSEPIADFKETRSEFHTARLGVINTWRYKINREMLTCVAQLNKYLCANGLRLFDHINKVNALLGFPPINVTDASSSSSSSEPGTRTFLAILKEVEALLPLVNMKAVFDMKKASSTAFKNLYAMVNSTEFAAMVKEIHNLPSNQKANEMLAQHGVDYKDLFRVYQELIGWEEIYTVDTV
ncbi:hypothetical protein PR048_017120 [Dryococelus australis]|uniref:Uncharacterized protein n=1 Tax=Dryococelus australis TaxID=614101 RepID=A0ABQ9H8M3_9NEOP|nr:hypothetical protein PR048_017120 [Dryococelus australis]